MHASRRSFLGGAAGLLASEPVWAQPANGPIRIGCIVALSGPQEVLGRPILDSAEIAADEINEAGGVLGRKLEIVAGGGYADADRAVELARQMGKEGINLLCGLVTSDSALAVAATLESLNAVLITCSAQTDKLTHEAFVPNVFRVTDQVYMRNRAQAHLMVQRYPNIARWGAILPESEYGRASWAAFRDGLIEAYPTYAKRDPVMDEPVTAKFGATDFRPQIAELRKKGADGLFVAVYGDDGISYYQQAVGANALAHVTAVADSYNEFLVPLSFGGTMSPDLWLAMSWYYGGYQDIEKGRQLYIEYLRRSGNPLPSGLIYAGHSAVHAYAAAIAKARSTETAAVIAAMQGMTLDTAKGPVTFRAEDHQAVCDVNFVRIKRPSNASDLDMVDSTRSDIEIAEFIRYPGASVIEPPSPGKPIVHHA